MSHWWTEPMEITGWEGAGMLALIISAVALVTWLSTYPWIPASDREECSECIGSGHDQWCLDMMGGPEDCLRCDGKGWVRK